VELKAAVAVRKTKNISDLEATAHEELAKIAQKRCQVITTKKREY